MLRFFANRALGAFARRYDYDVEYMRAILTASPRAFMKLPGLTKLASHREAAPVEAYYAAKLVGALAEDCGPCTQLVVNMALEAGVPADQIAAVLKGDGGGMSADTALGFRFASEIAHRTGGEEEVREAVRTAWGEKGLIDLTLGLQAGRLFPMIKAGLGFALECRRVTVAGNAIDTVKRAA